MAFVLMANVRYVFRDRWYVSSHAVTKMAIAKFIFILFYYDNGKLCPCCKKT